MGGLRQGSLPPPFPFTSTRGGHPKGTQSSPGPVPGKP